MLILLVLSVIVSSYADCDVDFRGRWPQEVKDEDLIWSANCKADRFGPKYRLFSSQDVRQVEANTAYHCKLYWHKNVFIVFKFLLQIQSTCKPSKAAAGVFPSSWYPSMQQSTLKMTGLIRVVAKNWERCLRWLMSHSTQLTTASDTSSIDLIFQQANRKLKTTRRKKEKRWCLSCGKLPIVGALLSSRCIAY